MNNSVIKKYLNGITQICTGNQREFYRWVLKSGQSFTGNDRDRQKEREVIDSHHMRIHVKECFYNAQLLAVQQKDLHYYEGWYVADVILPFEHGFLVHDGRVIDVTANMKNISVKEYFGIPIPTNYIQDFILKHKIATSLLGIYWGKNVAPKTK